MSLEISASLHPSKCIKSPLILTIKSSASSKGKQLYDILITSWKKRNNSSYLKKIKWKRIHIIYAQQVGKKKLQLFGTVVCFKILFHFHIPNSLNSEQIKVLQIIPQKKKKKRQETQINNYLSILFHHDNKQMVLIFWRLIPEQLKTQQDIKI